MPDPSDIDLVTVAYNSSGVIGDMLATVPPGVRVTIVDNASDDHRALADLTRTWGADLHRCDTNVGFGAGCNLGAALGKRAFLLFLNPDAQLDLGCIDALCAAAASHPEAVAFSPRVLDRRNKPAFRRRSRLLARTRWWMGAPPERDCTVPLLNGAAIFVRRPHFEAVGGFDEKIFLYHEDDDLSIRLSEECGPLMHVHAATVRHAEGRSMARTAETARFKAFHMGQSAVYAMEKHGRPAPKVFVVLDAVMQFLSPLTLLSKRKRAKALGFLQGSLTPISKGTAP
jgi:GT2 family glycosyltransferase